MSCCRSPRKPRARSEHPRRHSPPRTRHRARPAGARSSDPRDRPPRPGTTPGGRAGTSRPGGSRRPRPRAPAPRDPRGARRRDGRHSAAWAWATAASGTAWAARRTPPEASSRLTASRSVGSTNQYSVGMGRPSSRSGAFSMTAGVPSVLRTATVNAPEGTRPRSRDTVSLSSRPPALRPDPAPVSGSWFNARIRGRAPCATRSLSPTRCRSAPCCGGRSSTEPSSW